MTISATSQGLRMGVATSTSRPAVPFDGQVISETDTDSLKVYNGSAWVGVGTFTAFTPTWTNYTRGNGTTDSRYAIIGKTIYVYISETLGSTSSMGSAPSFTLPVTARSIASVSAAGNLLNSGDAYYPVFLTASSTTTVYLDALNAAGTYAKSTGVSSTVPFSWTTGDAIYINLTYEAA